MHTELKQFVLSSYHREMTSCGLDVVGEWKKLHVAPYMLHKADLPVSLWFSNVYVYWLLFQDQDVWTIGRQSLVSTHVFKSDKFCKVLKWYIFTSLRSTPTW